MESLNRDGDQGTTGQPSNNSVTPNGSAVTPAKSNNVLKVVLGVVIAVALAVIGHELHLY